jgi:hypothetical protein
VWFAVGPDVSLLWQSGGAQGVAHGSKLTRMFELLTYHTALGVLLAAVAASALPRARVLRRTAWAEGLEPDTGRAPAASEPAAEPREPAPEAEPATTREPVVTR